MQTQMDALIEQIVEELYRRLQGDGLSPGKAAGPLAGMIDHTLLKAEGTADQIVRLCAEARQNKFASVCVHPSYVPLAYRELRESGVKVCTVIGFPLGATTTKTKVFEAQEAIENGAAEVDMVINIGMIKSGDWEGVKNDVESVVIAAGDRALVKVILETCLLTDEEKTQACVICKQAGADFVKTSTGFSTGGATVDDVALMRRTVGPQMGVKASGGIKDAAFARKLVEAGATRLGTSSGVEIVRGGAGKSAY